MKHYKFLIGLNALQKQQMKQEFVSSPLKIVTGISDSDLERIFSQGKPLGFMAVEGESMADAIKQLSESGMKYGSDILVLIKSRNGYSMPTRELSSIIEFLANVDPDTSIKWGLDSRCDIESNLRVSMLFTLKEKTDE